MKVIRIAPGPDAGRRLRAFVDIQFENGVILKGFRILQEPGRRATIACPMASVKMPGKPPFLKTMIVLPDEIKGQIDLLILNAWNELIRQKEIPNEQGHST